MKINVLPTSLSGNRCQTKFSLKEKKFGFGP